jgi:SAM-dependent methyltransferase
MSPLDPDHRYLGEELGVFADARCWKAYWRSFIWRHLEGEVLEVGAGLGANTRHLWDGRQRRWLCLEPDPSLARQTGDYIASRSEWSGARVETGRLASLPVDDRFDAILYLDVLEHIPDDEAELASAVSHLRPNGRLIVLAPAHQSLFSEFDEAIGHHRRYDAGSLSSVVPRELREEGLWYLDAVGYLASLANRLLLRQKVPSARQIRFWDRLLVPCSRPLDWVLRYRVGRSILGVWRR